MLRFTSQRCDPMRKPASQLKVRDFLYDVSATVIFQLQYLMHSTTRLGNVFGRSAKKSLTWTEIRVDLIDARIMTVMQSTLVQAPRAETQGNGHGLSIGSIPFHPVMVRQTGIIHLGMVRNRTAGCALSTTRAWFLDYKTLYKGQVFMRFNQC